MNRAPKLLISIVCGFVVVLSGCKSSSVPADTKNTAKTSVIAPAQKSVQEQTVPTKPVLLSAVPSVRPSWADDEIPRSSESEYFVGTSEECSDESEARDGARANANKQIAAYFGTVVKSTVQGKKNIKSTDKRVQSYIEQDELLQSFAERYVTQVKTDSYYTEQWQSPSGKKYWKCYALCSISKEQAQKEINSFAGKVSEQFIGLMPENLPGKYNSVQSAIEAYVAIYQVLCENPVYQAVAYVDTPSGKASLDEYVLLQAKRLVTECNISVESAPSKIGRGSVGSVVFKVESPEYQTLGKMKYKAELIGAGIDLIRGSGTIDADGRASVQVSTGDLDFGAYSLAVHPVYDGSKNELGLVEGASAVAQFDVTPVFFSVKFDCTGDVLEDEIPKSSITTALQRGIQNYDIPMQISTSSDDVTLWQFVINVDIQDFSDDTGMFQMNAESSVSVMKNGIIQAISKSFSGEGVGKSRNAAVSNALKECAGSLEKDDAFFAMIAAKIE